MPRCHHLKLWPEFYEPVADRQKTFELRKNDRGFAEGDKIVFREWNPEINRYTGREIVATITYMLPPEVQSRFPVSGDYALFSVQVTAAHTRANYRNLPFSQWLPEGEIQEAS